MFGRDEAQGVPKAAAAWTTVPVITGSAFPAGK